MSVLMSLRALPIWTWRCVRAWLEIGQRMQKIELDLKEQAAVREACDQRLRDSISAVLESEKAALDQIHSRIESLDTLQSERLAELDRTLQRRVDDWARQLSAQINQLYAVAARDPVELRKR